MTGIAEIEYGETEAYWQGRVCCALNELSAPEAAELIDGWLSRAPVQEQVWIRSTLNDVYWFFAGSGCEALEHILNDARTETLQLTARDAIFNAHNGELAGVCLRRKGEQGVLFLPAASEPGRVRYSEFDKKGFFFHDTFDNYQDALESVWAAGYREEMPQSWFITLSSTPEWQAGMARVHEIAEHNKQSFLSRHRPKP